MSLKTIWNVPKIEFRPFADIHDSRRTLLVTSGPAWEAVHGQLNLNVRCKVEPLRATRDHWDALMAQDEDGLEVVYTVGGGLAADAAKYMALRLDLPLICLPTALTVDAFFTWASGVREDGCVTYIETKTPELAVIDLDVLAAAPLGVRAAGVCDVFSIATGLWDWRLADARGQNPPEMLYQPWAADIAQDILEHALDSASAAGRGDKGGLKALLDCLVLEVQLCNQIGHARPEEGSEHYFAYAVENYMGEALPHGDLVGPGILIMAGQQGQETERLEQALRDCHIPLESIPREVVAQTLQELPTYCRRHALPYGIAHEL